ncbi:hypothetical protein Q8A67_010627 [Cirrhinus molitorella]|uniref:Chemokine interleukin-8-like domain-containing protein n=1 Tax=Cirrhinus molitorella TaxID=172907 RepID=A0AA88PSS1_9TELE|nr:hypothetical protein Q8A67_010627 [Cirrhinus molitorella]
MEHKATSVLLLICITTIIILTSTEVDAIRCCLRSIPSKMIPKRMLVSVSKHYILDKSGICGIDAVILFTKRNQFCTDHAVLDRLNKLKRKRSRGKAE